MTKAELIERVAVATDVTKKQAEACGHRVRRDRALVERRAEDRNSGIRPFRLRGRGDRMGAIQDGREGRRAGEEVPYFKPGKE